MSQQAALLLRWNYCTTELWFFSFFTFNSHWNFADFFREIPQICLHQFHPGPTVPLALISSPLWYVLIPCLSPAFCTLVYTQWAFWDWPNDSDIHIPCESPAFGLTIPGYNRCLKSEPTDERYLPNPQPQQSFFSLSLFFKQILKLLTK